MNFKSSNFILSDVFSEIEIKKLPREFRSALDEAIKERVFAFQSYRFVGSGTCCHCCYCQDATHLEYWVCQYLSHVLAGAIPHGNCSNELSKPGEYLYR